MLLAHLLGHLITIGTLRVIDADGRNHVFSGAPGPEVTIRLHDPALYRKLFFNPRLYAGEAYMDGTLTVEGGTIYDFLDLVSWNMERAPRHPFRPIYAGFGKFLRGLQQYNPIRRSRANVAHHYLRATTSRRRNSTRNAISRRSSCSSRGSTSSISALAGADWRFISRASAASR